MSSSESHITLHSAEEYKQCLQNTDCLDGTAAQVRTQALGARLRCELDSLQALLAFHEEAISACDCDLATSHRCFAWLSTGFAQSVPPATTQVESLDRFRQLCDAAPIPMFIQDGEGMCVHVNPPLLDLLGVEPEHCLGDRWMKILMPADREETLDQFKVSRENRATFRGDFRVATPAHQALWISVQSAPQFDEGGQEIARIGVVENIEERKQADLALRQSEEKFRILTETVPASIFIFRGSVMLYVNPYHSQLTGFDRDELLNMPPWNVIHPDMRDLARERALARQKGDTSVPTRYEMKLLRKDGGIRWSDYTARVIEYGGATAVLGVAVDITDRLNAESEAKRLHADLIHLSRVSTLGKLATELAHELNQPLAAIVNYANGSRRRAVDTVGETHPLLPAIDEIRTEAERAAQIVKRIRNFARKRPKQRSLTPINDLISEATHLALKGSGSGDVRVQYDLQEGLPVVRVDRVQIIQVLVNLVSNAIEAMDEIAAEEQSLTISSTLNDEGQVEIAVTDIGQGFNGDSADTMFEPFFTTKREGLGLGLSISRSIAEAHGGRLWAEACPVRGAVFKLVLPQ